MNNERSSVGPEQAPDNVAETTLPSAQELIDRGELDLDDYKSMLQATLFDHDMRYVPKLLKENQANGKAIPKEAYTAYIDRFGVAGMQELAWNDHLETSYIPELAEVIGGDMAGPKDEMLMQLIKQHEDVKFDPRFQRAVARYGGGSSQFKLFQWDRSVAAKGIYPEAVDALRARGSRFAPYPPHEADRSQAELRYEGGLVEIRNEHWSSLKQAKETRDEAIRAAWDGVDDEPASNAGESHQPGESELAADQKQWQAIFTYLEEIDKAKTTREQTVDKLIAQGPRSMPWD